MFQFRINGKAIALLLANTPNTNTRPQWTGDRSTIEAAWKAIAKGYNPFGHTMEPDSINAIDLHFTLTQAGMTVEIMEGGDRLQKYDPMLPPGAQT